MIELGKTLRTAREAKGLTIRQLAEITKLAPSVIERIELENFTEIAAPIYGRGFIKLYCEAVGLDPKPHVAEYMDIVNGAHEPGIKERPVAAESADVAPDPILTVPEQPAEPDTVSEPPVAAKPTEPEPIEAFGTTPDGVPPAGGETYPGSDFTQAPPVPERSFQADLFSGEPIVEPPVSKPTIAVPPPAAEPDVEPPSFSRYAAPIRHNQAPSSLSAYRRLALLAVGVLVLVALLVWGLRALYRFLSTDPDAQPEPRTEQSATPAPRQPAQQPAQKLTQKPASPAAPATVQKTNRTPQKIADLYID